MTRAFTPEELFQLQELHRAVVIKRFEMERIKENTASVPRGQELVIEYDAIIHLLETFKDNWVSQTLVNCGYPQNEKYAIDLKTGEVVLQSKP